MASFYDRSMVNFSVLVLAAAIVFLVTPAANASEQPRNEQSEARREMRAGNALQLRDIERRVIASMPDYEYIGSSYDPAARAYRLTFIREGRVTFVDVDARTGRILHRSR